MVRLGSLALASWSDLDGWAASRGLPDLRKMSLERFCNLVWYWATRGASEQETEKFRMKLWRPPPGVKVARGPWAPEAETAALQAFKAQAGL